MIHPAGQRDIEEICERLAAVDEFRDLEVLKYAVRKERGTFYVKVVIDREGGVNSAICEAVSRFIERRIEELPAPTPLFHLEVASAGLARPLLRPEHYRRFRGKKINLITTLRIKKRTDFTGAIMQADDNAVTIDDMRVGATPIPYALIKRANLIYDPSEDLKKARRT